MQYAPQIHWNPSHRGAFYIYSIRNHHTWLVQLMETFQFRCLAMAGSTKCQVQNMLTRDCWQLGYSFVRSKLHERIVHTVIGWSDGWTDQVPLGRAPGHSCSAYSEVSTMSITVSWIAMLKKSQLTGRHVHTFRTMMDSWHQELSCMSCTWLEFAAWELSHPALIAPAAGMAQLQNIRKHLQCQGLDRRDVERTIQLFSLPEDKTQHTRLMWQTSIVWTIKFMVHAEQNFIEFQEFFKNPVVDGHYPVKHATSCRREAAIQHSLWAESLILLSLSQGGYQVWGLDSYLHTGCQGIGGDVRTWAESISSTYAVNAATAGYGTHGEHIHGLWKHLALCQGCRWAWPLQSWKMWMCNWTFFVMLLLERWGHNLGRFHSYIKGGLWWSQSLPMHPTDSESFFHESLTP